MAGKLTNLGSKILGGNGVVGRSIASSLRLRSGMGLPVGKHIVPDKPVSNSTSYLWKFVSKSVLLWRRFCRIYDCFSLFSFLRMMNWFGIMELLFPSPVLIALQIQLGRYVGFIWGFSSFISSTIFVFILGFFLFSMKPWLGYVGDWDFLHLWDFWQCGTIKRLRFHL